MVHTLRRLPTMAVLALLQSIPLAGQTAENVALVINDASQSSQRIGDHYVRRRGVPASNVIHIRTTQEETIERAAFVSTIQQPIAATLGRERLQDRVLYIVLTKGIPLRIAGTSGTDGTVASVDSELTLLYRRMTGGDAPFRGRIDNPYFLGTRDVGEARPFTHRERDMYLVTRLDAFTDDQALELVDKAREPAQGGRVVLDQRNALVNRTGEDWLERAADRLRSLGHGDRVLLETTAKGARDVSPVIGYYSWGSNDPGNRVRTVGMGFVPGSLAATFVSSDGRTFKEPPADWLPASNWSDQKTWFGGSPQSLIGDLIREGATGVAGHVAEPYLQSTIRPEVLFPAYLSGFNLAEAFYLAMPHLSWQNVVVGDPLCRPFSRRPLTRSDIEDDLDPDTELPRLFSARRVAQAAQVADAPKPAVTMLLRGESRLARGDKAGGREALEEATRLGPRLSGAHLLLAALYQQAGEHDSAIGRYRRILELEPNEVTVLNNLAYSLAVHQNAPAEALPLAKKASALAPGSAIILDTLGWIEHLLGNTAAATKLIAEAARLEPRIAEIRLHSAVVSAEAGAREVAEHEPKEALRLDPSLETRGDVKQLRERLAALAREPEFPSKGDL